MIEPTLQGLTGESPHERTANITDEARIDISAREFWVSSQRTFFDIRVFNPMARGYVSQELTKAYKINEREKKKQYNEGTLEVEHGAFTPLVVTTLGGMGRELSKSYSRLLESIAEKLKKGYSVIKNWISWKDNLQNALSKSLLTMYTLVGEIYNCHDSFWRVSGFPDLFGKVFSVNFKFS